MKDILKMVQFDFIAGEKLLPLCLIVLAADAAAAMLLMPAVAPVFIPFAVCIFLPVQSIAARCGFNKLYGILPIRRSTVTRAAFLEYTVSALIGEVISVLIYTAAKAAKLYLSVRQALSGIIEDSTQQNSNQSAAIAVILFAVICMFICYMRMMSDIFGQENEAKILILTVFVLLVILTPLLVLRLKNILPPAAAWLPKSTGGKALLICAAHLATFGICALFCEITVKKLANREL